MPLLHWGFLFLQLSLRLPPPLGGLLASWVFFFQVELFRLLVGLWCTLLGVCVWRLVVCGLSWALEVWCLRFVSFVRRLFESLHRLEGSRSKQCRFRSSRVSRNRPMPMPMTPLGRFSQSSGDTTRSEDFFKSPWRCCCCCW